MNKLKYIALLLLAVVLIGSCLGQYLYITDLTKTLLRKSALITDAIRQHDLTAADTALSDFTLLWNNHRRRLYSLTDHQRWPSLRQSSCPRCCG